MTTYIPNEDPRVRAVVDLLTDALILATSAERSLQRYMAGRIDHYPRSDEEAAREAQARAQHGIYDLAASLVAERSVELTKVWGKDFQTGDVVTIDAKRFVLVDPEDAA